MSSNSSKLETLKEWLSENEIWYDPEVLEIREDGGQYSVWGKSGVPAGEKACIIPKPAVLSTQTTGIANILQDEEIGGGVALTLSLLFEYSQGEDSPWHGYIQSLPKSEDLPILWSDEEVKLLEGTEIHESIGKEKIDLKDDYENLVMPILEKYPTLFPKDIFTFENFLNASTVVASRAFQVDDYHGDALLPLADLFNHKTADENLHIETNENVCEACGAFGPCEHDMYSDDEEDEEEEAPELVKSSQAKAENGSGDTKGEESEEDEEGYESDMDDDIIMSIVKPIEKNKQVFNTYGEHPNVYLLSKYGFAEEHNPYDFVAVDLETVQLLCAKTVGNDVASERFDFYEEVGQELVMQFLPQEDEDDEETPDDEEMADYEEISGDEMDEEEEGEGEEEEEEDDEDQGIYYQIQSDGTFDRELIYMLHVVCMEAPLFKKLSKDPSQAHQYISTLKDMLDQEELGKKSKKRKSGKPAFSGNPLVWKLLKDLITYRAKCYTPVTTLEEDTTRLQVTIYSNALSYYHSV
ncbi:hypothetical protein K7432_011450 [Basidiobolus ranarum]|uniref:Ribosomal lysine N-methyltransferase 4 n=1 Tax=Basidiobolus ranarum TaxID=34480 RepID=A0ABR2WMC7_9FUNG